MRQSDQEVALERELLKSRVIRLKGDIDEGLINHLRELLLTLEVQSQGEIKLLINSLGGEVEYVLHLVDTMTDLMQSPVTGIVNGVCASAAVAILQACKLRLATRHSILFCHSVSLNFTSTFKNVIVGDGDVQGRADTRVRLGRENQEAVEQLLMQRTGWTQEEVKRQMRLGDTCEHFIHAPTAKELGLIDDIVGKNYSLLSLQQNSAGDSS